MYHINDEAMFARDNNYNATVECFTIFLPMY